MTGADADAKTRIQLNENVRTELAANVGGLCLAGHINRELVLKDQSLDVIETRNPTIEVLAREMGQSGEEPDGDLR